MKGNVVRYGASNEFNPSLWFDIKFENDKDKGIIFVNVISKVTTASPMKSNINLGRLIPREASMYIPARGFNRFTFDLNLDGKRLNAIEGVRKDDVWFEIYMNTLYVELKDWSPLEFGWDSFSLGMGDYSNRVRIPESDWLKLRSELGYEKARIIEVTEHTYKLLEEFRSKHKLRDLDEAIHEAILIARSKKEAQND